MAALFIVTDAPFIRGRALWFASQFAKLLPPSLAHQYCEAAVKALQNHEESIPVRISAIKAVQTFLQDSDSPQAHMQAPIVHGVCDLLGVATEDALILLLETLSFAISIDIKTAASMQSMFVPLLLKIWTRYAQDHIINSSIVEIFEQLATEEALYHPLLAQAGPVIIHILHAYRADSEESCIAASNAIDVLGMMVKKSPVAPPPDLVSLLVPALVLLSEPSMDDPNILQSGQTFLQSLVERFLSALPTLMVAIPSRTAPVNGLEVLLLIFDRLLDPQRTTESASIFVGDLLLKYFIHGVGSPAVDNSIPHILASITTRLAEASIPTMAQVSSMVWPDISRDL